MLINNLANRFRRDVLFRVAKILFSGEPLELLNRIPYEMIRSQDEPVRCCIHHDRAVVRARVMAALGFSLEEHFEIGNSLSQYALEALNRQKITAPFLTLLNDACNACLNSRYMVTNACQGCVARPCMINCPKHAISMQNKRAVIDNDTCVNCGICLKACPYDAIVNLPIPCELACPVDAISRDPTTGKEKIDYTRCIHCGKCMTQCPFGAMMERSQMLDVISRLVKGEKMVAFFAPAIVVQFPNNTPGKLTTALKKLGFHQAIEVAFGADMTTQNESKEFVEKMEHGETLMTTSCCPAYYEAVQRHIPEIAHAVSTTRSPMIYTAQYIQEHYPDCKKVFIGPCLAKRSEALKSNMIDYVISMEELGAMLMAKEIQISDCQEAEMEVEGSILGRRYAVTSGVAGAVKAALPEHVECRSKCINGLNKQAIQLLKLYGTGKLNDANLLEVMACEGGCVAGPSVIANPKVSTRALGEKL